MKTRGARAPHRGRIHWPLPRRFKLRSTVFQLSALSRSARLRFWKARYSVSHSLVSREMFVADKPPASFPCNAASDPTVADAICDWLLHPAPTGSC